MPFAEDVRLNSVRDIGQAKPDSVTYLSPVWPILFAVAGTLLVIRELANRKAPNLSPTSRLFLLLAASLFALAGLADLIIRLAVTGRW